jgi:hypothetical protein
MLLYHCCLWWRLTLWSPMLFPWFLFLLPTECLAEILCEKWSHIFCLTFFFFATSLLGFNNLERVLYIEIWMKGMINSRAQIAKPFCIWDNREEWQTRREGFCAQGFVLRPTISIIVKQFCCL